MIQKHWTFTQTTAATTWNVNNVPEGATGAVIAHIVADDGQILQPDNQLVSPDGLQLSFGVEAVSGTAYGDYYVEEPTTETIVDQVGNVVNITMNSGLRS